MGLCSQPASLLKRELRWRKVKFGATGKPKSRKRRSRRSPRPPPHSRRLRLRPRRNRGKNSATATSSPQQSGWAHWPVAVAALRAFSASKEMLLSPSGGSAKTLEKARPIRRNAKKVLALPLGPAARRGPATDSQRFAWIVLFRWQAKVADPWLYPRGELNE